jgi:hypothetical protein
MKQIKNNNNNNKSNNNLLNTQIHTSTPHKLPLRHVDDGGTIQASKHATVGDGESSAHHVLHGQGVVLRLLSEASNALLHVLLCHSGQFLYFYTIL